MCAGIRPLLGVYLTGAIAPADRAVVVRHLAACADCRTELAGLAGLPGLLRRSPVYAAAQALGEDDPALDNTARTIRHRKIRRWIVRFRSIRFRMRRARPGSRCRGGWSAG